MNYTHFIGIDVSKDTLDFAIVQGKNVIKQGVVANSPTGILSLLKEVKQQVTKELDKVLFCMEHTGIYNQFLLELLSHQKLNIVIEASMQIKRSMGLVRGKNDKVDALRIAEYACKNSEELICWQPPRPVIKQLKTMSVTRSRLIHAKKQLSVTAKETKGFDKASARIMERYSKNSLAGLEKDLAQVEAGIKKVIESDEVLSRLFEQITSVDGIGKVTAVEVILTTNEFKNFTDPAKFACNCGVAPFEHRSGSSIRGRTRVSHNANKSMKTLLHMSSLSAIKVNDDLKTYYERKVAEGKNKMLVLNAIRRKLIDRIFACVKQNRKFIKNYALSLA